MATLYELTEEWQQLIAMMDDPELDPQVLQDTMEALEGELEDKVDGYGKVIREVEAQKAALKAEIDRLTARSRAIDKNLDRLKEAVKQAMIATDKPKIKTALFTFSVAKKPASVVVDKELNEIPAFYQKVSYAVDKTKIKDALKAGEQLDFAHLEQGEALRIK